MSYVLIPVPPQPNVLFSCILDGQPLRCTLQTTDAGLFATANYAGTQIANSRICLDRTDINTARYLGLPGALFFADLQGTSDPVWTGFNSRFVFVYGNPDLSGGSSIP